ncbi:MAG: helix-turn-helix domain-containing protein, partial [Rubrobacteraceae bacterium]
MSEGNEFSAGKKGLLEVDEVAGYLGVTPVTVYRWCRDGSLPCLNAWCELLVRNLRGRCPRTRAILILSAPVVFCNHNARS